MASIGLNPSSDDACVGFDSGLVKDLTLHLGLNLVEIIPFN